MKMFTRFFITSVIMGVMSGSHAFAQIVQRGTATSATTTNTTLTINKPTGVVAGDVMIVNIAQGGNNSTAPVLAGWTIIDGRSLAGGTQRYGAALYRVADGTEGSSFTFTLGSGTDAAAGSVIAFSGVDVTGGVKADGSAGGPFDVDPGTFNLGGSGSTTSTGLSITTATANAAVIMLAGAAGGNPSWSGWTTTSPGALTELYDNATGSNTAASVGAAWAIKTTAGATGNGTASLSVGERNGGILLALKRISGPSVMISPSTTQTIIAGGSVSFTATALNYTGTGNYTYTWTASGATIPGSNPNSIAANSDTKSLAYAAAGTYTVSVSIARAGSSTLVTGTVTVIVNPAPNLWATSSNGTQISSFTVSNGTYISGPNNLFAASFPGTTTGGTSTAALARNAEGGIANGYFYWLPNTSGNGGVVEVFAATATGGTPTRIGSVDVNGSSTNSLGFVRLGMGPDGYGWLLAGDGANLYLAKFLSNGVNPVTITPVPVSLGTGSAGTFQNGDICISGNNKLFALANDGNGVTQIFVGNLNSPSVIINPRLNLVDQNDLPFVGTVNGVAFDDLGSAYISTGTGLYYIDAATVNGPAATVQCSLVVLQTGLQDLASNYFPTGSPLPVTLIDFKGNYRDQKTTLAWETENMQNFSHFEVERGTSGNSFTTIGSLNQKGDGMARTQYQYIDNLSGLNDKVFYYRLKMIDIDGKFSYSNIILTRKEQTGTDNMLIYPNPLTSGAKATVSFIASANKTVSFSVTDMSGKVVLTQQTNVSQGNNSVTIKSVDALQPGMYILRANDGESTMSAKFYITR